MDSFQDYQEAKKRIQQLQDWPELDVVEKMELDRLIKEVNEFQEKITNFE